MTSLFVEHLTVIDCAYLHAQRGLVGESWIVDIELEGELDDQSMVLDFGEVKRRLKRSIDSGVDHTLLVPALAPALELHARGAMSELFFRGPARGPLEHAAPTCALTRLDAAEVDGEALARHLETSLGAVLPPSVARFRVGLRNETACGAYFHYTHGLKKHQGHCQRIAHGHRSRLEIRIDGHRDDALENAWATRWQDIYLGTRTDLVSNAGGRMRFEYTAQEGRFALELPSVACDLLDADTTVERIAEHLAAQVSLQRPRAAVDVRAYEGVMKGAVARIAG